MVAWRLYKSPAQWPVQRGAYYETTWHDGDQLRRVRARKIMVDWTFHDPELVNRERLPKDLRRDLFTPKPLPNTVTR